VWISEEMRSARGKTEERRGKITHRGGAKADAQVAQGVPPWWQVLVRAVFTIGSGEEMRRFGALVDNSAEASDEATRRGG
jgi:hypothetical protein